MGGAAFLQELVDDIDDLCENLGGLVPGLRDRLCAALAAQCAIENTYAQKPAPCIGSCHADVTDPAAVVALVISGGDSRDAPDGLVWSVWDALRQIKSGFQE